MAKKVKGSGFHFGDAVEGDDVSMASFYDWLVTHNGTTNWPFESKILAKRAKEGSITRHAYFNNTEEFFCGLIVTSSNDKHDHFLENREGTTFVVQREITGAPPVKLNFFAIRKDLNNGLYSHYRESHPFGDFLKDLWWSYRTFVKSVSTQDKTYNTSKHQNTGPLYSKDAFDKLLKSFKNIQEVNVLVPEMLQPDDAPEAPDVKGSSIAIRFDSINSTQKIRTWIKWLRDKSMTKRPHGSVTGIDDDGEPITVDFHKTLEDHLSWSYESIGDVNTSDIIGHAVTARLIKCLNENALFAKSIKRRDHQ